MLGWLELAILLLKVANKLINWLHDQGKIDEGRRQVIAENALNIAAKVGVKEKIREKVDAMSEDELDQELRDLEPPAAGDTKPMHTRADR